MRDDGTSKVVAVDITPYTGCSVLVLIPEHCLPKLQVELYVLQADML